MNVELTWPEVIFACQVGTMRRISAMRSGRIGSYGATDDDTWGHDINGAIAEMAVAKWAGLFWSGSVGRIDLPDVGQMQVRSKMRKTDRLVIRPSDRDDQVFVSVLVNTPLCHLCGWLWGYQGKDQSWLVEINRPAMYFIPDNALRPMTELKRKSPTHCGISGPSWVAEAASMRALL